VSGGRPAVAELALAVLVTKEHASVPEIANGIAPALIESGWRERGWRPGTDARIHRWGTALEALRARAIAPRTGPY
jgi:hypothetical protein